MLAERGAIDYETRVAELWPEFAAHGKHAVTVRHVLNHTAGVPGIPLTTTIEDLCDWDKMCSAIAAAELWWEPGTKIGYHAYTFGYIVGEIEREALVISALGLLVGFALAALAGRRPRHDRPRPAQSQRAACRAPQRRTHDLHGGPRRDLLHGARRVRPDRS